MDKTVHLHTNSATIDRFLIHAEEVLDHPHPNVLLCHETFFFTDSAHHILSVCEPYVASLFDLVTVFLTVDPQPYPIIPEPQLAYILSHVRPPSFSVRLPRSSSSSSDLVGCSPQTIKGLCFSQEVHPVHDEIKLENILITPDGRIVLSEIGWKLPDYPQRRSGVGCPLNYSPEKVKGNKYDGRSDVWSLAIAVRELIEGEMPYMEFPPLRALFLITTKGLPEFKKPELLSEEFKAFDLHCTVKEPENRPTAVDLLKEPLLEKACSKEEFLRFMEEFATLRDNQPAQI